MKLKKNMGKWDRIVRMLFAAVLVLLFGLKVVTGTLGLVVIILAVILAGTSFFAYCPLYMPFKFSTLKDEAPERSKV